MKLETFNVVIRQCGKNSRGRKGCVLNPHIHSGANKAIFREDGTAFIGNREAHYGAIVFEVDELDLNVL
jgi:hypothetical protein